MGTYYPGLPLLLDYTARNRPLVSLITQIMGLLLLCTRVWLGSGAGRLTGKGEEESTAVGPGWVAGQVE